MWPSESESEPTLYIEAPPAARLRVCYPRLSPQCVYRVSLRYLGVDIQSRFTVSDLTAGFEGAGAVKLCSDFSLGDQAKLQLFDVLLEALRHAPDATHLPK